ncbi:MAG: RNase adapter RapZ [Acidobacteriota bacterium]
MAALKSSDQLQSLVIITGMSGSGKHTAFKAFEDLGYFCVDNLPTPLIPRLIQMSDASGGKIRELAIVVDIRLGESLAQLKKLFSKIKQLSSKATIIFVDASDEVLARRYSETRRVHPLARGKSLVQGIRAERRKLSDLRALAGLVVDTSDFSVHDLRNLIYQNFRQTQTEDTLNVSVVSFGFKYGIPYNSDLVFDVRFLPNPNFVPRLKPKTGNDPAVVKYMKKSSETGEILAKIYDMLEYLLPKYAKEGKKYLAISIGCTGGRHRSVVVANELRERLEGEGRKVNLIHRDLHNE